MSEVWRTLLSTATRWRHRQHEELRAARSLHSQSAEPAGWVRWLGRHTPRPLPARVADALGPVVTLLGSLVLAMAGLTAVILGLLAVGNLALLLMNHSHLLTTHPAWAAYLLVATAVLAVAIIAAGSWIGRHWKWRR